jgi:hypothetical protein
VGAGGGAVSVGGFVSTGCLLSEARAFALLQIGRAFALLQVGFELSEGDERDALPTLS